MSHDVYIAELGCAKNTVDAEVMRDALGLHRYGIAASPADADVIVVNTCSFLEAAVDQSIDTILDLAQHKRTGRCRGLIVAGCLGSRYGADLLKQLPEADAVVSSSEAWRIAEACDQVLAGRRFYWQDDPDGRDVGAQVTRGHTTAHPWAYVKIMEGCDHPCSFCIIPDIRGGFRSRPLDAIVDEVNGLAARGVREVNLVAQDSTAYGLPESGRARFAELLQALNDRTTVEWVRVHYAYPTGMTDDVIDALAHLPRVIPYLDMPVQHVDDGMLRAMRRKGGERYVRRLVDTLRDRIPGLVLRTTVIVGFPGETPAQFATLLDYVAEGRFDRLGAFTYSAEPGTAAAEWPDQVSAEEKEGRHEQIMLAQQEAVRGQQEGLVGETLEVLVEGVDPENADGWVGRSYRDAPEVDGVVHLSGPPDAVRVGDFVPVTITAADPYDLAGEAASPLPVA